VSQATFDAVSATPDSRLVKVPAHMLPAFRELSSVYGGASWIASAEIRCEETSSSPLISDAYDAAEILRMSLGRSLQKNLRGLRCTTIATKGTAAIGLCGKFPFLADAERHTDDTAPRASSARHAPVGDIIAWMIDECSESDVTHMGGWVKLNKDHKLVVFNSNNV